MSKAKRAQQHAPQTSPWVRGAIVGVASARIGSLVAGQRLREALGVAPASQVNTQIGQVLFGAMGQLRGTAVKAAQLLSLDADYLPEAVRLELAKACYQVLPMNRALVGRVFRQSFGKEPEQVFSRFDHPAVGAASLGQVHRASLPCGQELAVKVQYPGIAQALSSDMALLHQLLRRGLGQVLTLPKQELMDRALQAIEAQLLNETDYLQEARSAQWFAQHNRDTDLEFAQVLTDYSSPTVLTQTYLSGLPVEDYLAGKPTQSDRDRQGSALLHWFMRCAFLDGHFHGDMHPGNFLFLPQGRVAILDFGCTSMLIPRERSSIARAWLAQVERQPGPDQHAELLAAYQGLGLVSPTVHLSYFEQGLLPAIRPFLEWSTQALAKPSFDFADKYVPMMPEHSHQELMAKEVFSMPASVLSFDRAWLGLMHLMRRLGARVDMRPMRQLLHLARGAS